MLCSFLIAFLRACQFEITPEDDPGRSLVGSSPNEVHTALLESINTVW